jgi:hypothetical protein
MLPQGDVRRIAQIDDRRLRVLPCGLVIRSPTAGGETLRSGFRK